MNPPRRVLVADLPLSESDRDTLHALRNAPSDANIRPVWDGEKIRLRIENPDGKVLYL